VILTGWKQIAQHLGCGVRTAQRWQREGLPVKRVTKSIRSLVIAESDKLDSWMVRENAFRRAGREEAAAELLANLRRAEELHEEVQRATQTLQLKVAKLSKALEAALGGRRGAR